MLVRTLLGVLPNNLSTKRKSPKSPTAALLQYCDSASSVQDGAGRASQAVAKVKEEAAAVEAIWGIQVVERQASVSVLWIFDTDSKEQERTST